MTIATNTPNKEDIKQRINHIGGSLHLIYVDVKCLQHLLNFNKATPISNKKYSHIFEYFYRIFYDRMYINIYKSFLDSNKKVMSIKNFFKKTGETCRWKNIEDHDVFRKIKNKRNEVIAHSKQELALSQDKKLEHYEENKLQLSEIISFLEFVQSELEAVAAKVCTPISLYSLGNERKVREFKELLNLAFPNIDTQE